jgi:peptidoglycan/xylan/chitin deacetylase (PgdA/CDA1 family)
LKGWKEIRFPNWPVDCTVERVLERLLVLSLWAQGVEKIPFIWFWPEGARNCLLMTHDVETAVGRDFTPQLMDLNDSHGIKASFQVVPEKRYEVPDGYVNEIRRRGFEFNIHDLNHDGFLFREHEEFRRRAARINQYVHRYQSRGFRSGAMYRNEEWFDAFEFSYDMSVPSVAHLEPQRGGCCTIMPYFVGKILEIPLTTTQDYSLFHILNDYSIDLWKEQLSLIQQRHGLMSFIVHPDYVIKHRARKVYEALLDYLRQIISRENVWAALPGEVDCWWRARSQMKLVCQGNNWTVEGPEKDKARVAYAVLDGDRLKYELA